MAMEAMTKDLGLGKIRYPWVRYWAPRDGHYSLSNGYLDDSLIAREYGKSQAAVFEDFRHVPCLVLLGEPGIGKSSAIEHEYTLAKGVAVPGVNDVRMVDLRKTGDQNSFYHEAFEHDEMAAWKNGSGRMTLFIDSLDEGLMSMDRVAPILTKGLQELPIDRLHVRIACRTAEWPRGIEEALKGLWPKKGDLEFRELLQLSFSQVQAAAQARGFDPGLFMPRLSTHELQPLAAKPITLNFLLEAFARSEALARTKTEVYEQGCLILCEDERWDDGPKNAVLSGPQRLELVSRIAAVLVFCKKAAVWTGLEKNFTTNRESDVRASELIGGTEDDGTGPFTIELKHVEDALRTGLFTSRGLDRLGWAHQTYAEFLAARYIDKKGLTPIQVHSLVKNADDPEQKLIPQLRETVAWMVSKSQNLFEEVLSTDPEVLLRSDVALATPELKAELVRGLVRAFGDGVLSRRTAGLFERYDRLLFPGIADLLREFIVDRNVNGFAKDCAIDIAYQCKVREVAKEVCAIALDSSARMHLRATAAHFIAGFGGPEERNKLRRLADGIDEDHDDQLKGYALQALWPELISTTEVFELLKEPKKPDFFGGYRDFIAQVLPAYLKPQDMPVALEWLSSHQAKGRMEDRFDDLADELMYLGWSCLDEAHWIQEYASTAVLRMRSHDQIVGGFMKAQAFRDELTSRPERRKALIRAIMAQADEDVITSLAFSSRDPLLRDGDVHWMLEEVERNTGPQADLWSSLIRYTFQFNRTDEVEAILTLAARNEHLYKKFENLIEPDHLDDPRVQERRENELRWRHRREVAMPLLDPSPAVRVEAHLDRFESGDLKAWWQLVYHELEREPYRSPPRMQLEPDLRKFYGWVNADERNKARMLRAAKQYLAEFDPGTEEWLGKDVYHKPAIAGYKSLRLLQNIEPQALDDLSTDRWEAWTPIVLEYFVTSEVTESEASGDLAQMAYARAPHATHAVLPALLRDNDRRERYVTVLDRLSGCWDSALSEVVFPMLTEGGLKDHTWTAILRRLLNAEYQPALEMARNFIGRGDVRLELRSEAVALLLHHIPGDRWFAVWQELTGEVELAKDVLLRLSDRSWRHDRWFVDKLAVEEVVALFTFLEVHWPREEDPLRPSGVLVGVHPRMEIGEFRDSLLMHLRDRGTKEACVALESIQRAYPGIDWLKWTIQGARENARRKAWVPPSPHDLLTIRRDSAVRRIAGPGDLIDVVMESLERIHQRLQGETPEVPRLWNEGREFCTPKNEGALSDYLKGELKKELDRLGISIGREVQIRPTSPSASGQEVDLQVIVSTTDERGDPTGPASLIVEVKGSWNPELDEAMQTQLVRRYMADSGCQHGIYVVGWYGSAKWDPSDKRRRQTQRRDREETTKALQAQATRLSDGTRVVKSLVLDLTW